MHSRPVTDSSDVAYETRSFLQSSQVGGDVGEVLRSQERTVVHNAGVHSRISNDTVNSRHPGNDKYENVKVSK